jgi:membrane protease YdiL (CAAX protease family)
VEEPATQSPPHGAQPGARDTADDASSARSASSHWPPWTAPAALLSGVVLAALGGLLVDIPAAALGVNVSASHLPPGLVIADTFVQDIAFVLTAIFFAQLGARAVSASHFGLRTTRFGRAVRLIGVTLGVFLLFNVAWASITHAPREELLKSLGTDEGTALLLLSAALTCVVAPVCEELLFRGFIFTALCNWRGAWPAALITGVAFGAVHVGSAPAVDLVPLTVLGVALCWLYRATGSLYPCVAAHSLNNSLAFGSLEDWGWQIPLLMGGALALIALLALSMMRAGVIEHAVPTSQARGSIASR